MSAYLNVKRIEFGVTYRCNSRCKHCQVGTEKRSARPAVIDRDLAVDIVRKVTEIYHPSSIMTWGGEPLLYPDEVCSIHETAMACGIPDRTIITNAGNPRSAAQARDAARRLVESGVTGIWISVDAFHQEHIALQIVERNVQAYAEAGIPRLVWNPCWVVSVDDDNPWNQRTRAILDALATLPVETSGDHNTVQAYGSAKRWLKAYLPRKMPVPTGSCEDVPYAARFAEIDLIGIEPDGGISICHDWIIGNAANDDILELLESYDPYAIPPAKAMLEGGVAALAEWSRAQGVELDPDGYFSICDMCMSLRQGIMGRPG
jgi:hypothetical protein